MFHNCSAMNELGVYKLVIHLDLPFAWQDKHMNDTKEHLASQLLWMKLIEYYQHLGVSTSNLQNLLKKISGLDIVAASSSVSI